jgi:hypothetical protein
LRLLYKHCSLKTAFHPAVSRLFPRKFPKTLSFLDLSFEGTFKKRVLPTRNQPKSEPLLLTLQPGGEKENRQKTRQISRFSLDIKKLPANFAGILLERQSEILDRLPPLLH